MTVGGARWRWSLKGGGRSLAQLAGTDSAAFDLWGVARRMAFISPSVFFFFRLLTGDEIAGCFFFGLFFCLPLRQFRRLEKHVVGRPRFAPLCCGSDSSSGSFLASVANL